MRRFLRPSSYDLICNLFTSFGYFENEDEERLVLHNIHESLHPGGSFVIDVISKERVARNWKDSIVTEFPGGERLVQIPHVLDGWSRLRNEWILTKDGTARTFEFSHWLYSGQELKDRLRAAGFKEIRLFGDLKGAAYDIDATRLTAVARKA